MKVKELMAILSHADPEAEVFENRDSELRALRHEDVTSDRSGDGHPIADPDEETSGPIIIFGAWS